MVSTRVRHTCEGGKTASECHNRSILESSKKETTLGSGESKAGADCQRSSRL